MSLSKPNESTVNSVPKRKMRAWEVVLLVLGSPLWLSLLLAFFAVAFAGYVVLWALIVTVWSVEFALVVCSVVGLVSPIIYIILNNIPGMIAIFGIGIFCAGLAIILYFGCVTLSKGSIVYLPESAYNKLELESSVGDVEVPEYFIFEDVDIEASTAKITWNAEVKSKQPQAI